MSTQPSPQLPTFFFSYARDGAVETSRLLDRFFRDLEQELARRTQIDQAHRQLGVFDKRITYGTDWDTSLSIALSNSNVCLAITTPTYFTRPNCGKELAVFIQRTPDAWLDEDGCLRDITNILPIRWMNESAYQANGIKDAYIPALLRKIEDLAGTELDDYETKSAIERYMKKGMEVCVKPGTNRYKFLLWLIADRIRQAPALPAADFAVEFGAIVDAFNTDWSALPRRRQGSSILTPAPIPELLHPDGPDSLVAFYVTSRDLPNDPRPVTFADTLISIAQANAGNAAPFLKVMEWVQKAALPLNLNVFHCASQPANAAQLNRYLALLTERNVIILLIIDSDTWSMPTDARHDLDTVISSTTWRGVVLAPVFEDSSTDLPRHVERLPIPLDIHDLSTIDTLRAIITTERGRIVMRSAATAVLEDPAPLPVLQGVGARRG